LGGRFVGPADAETGASSSTMENILAAVDFSNATADVVQHAAVLTRQFSAKLWLLHVAAPDPDFVGYEVATQATRDQMAERFHQEHRDLQALAGTVRGLGVEATPLLVQGSTAEKILEEAQRLDADLIVLGSHGRGALFKTLVGSTSEGVLRKSRCPVTIVPISPWD
jgi:nucleotide-binding universal stress UspA family protein